MEKFIPYEKLSKKQKKAIDQAKRGSWGTTDPVTRIRPSKKVYDRKKARNWDDGSVGCSFFCSGCLT